MSLIFKKNIKTTILTFLFFLSTYAVGEEKSINYKCTGLSQFELLGSSGMKEEIKIDNESYYQSNAIARASKTMLQCMSSKTNSKITATKD